MCARCLIRRGCTHGAQVKARVRECQLHRDSPLGDTLLECYSCGGRNAFALGFVPVKSENSVVLLCRRGVFHPSACTGEVPKTATCARTGSCAPGGVTSRSSVPLGL